MWLQSGHCLHVKPCLQVLASNTTSIAVDVNGQIMQPGTVQLPHNAAATSFFNGVKQSDAFQLLTPVFNITVW